MERYLKKHKLLLVSLIIELVLLNIVNSGNSYINVAMTDSVMKQNIVAFLMYLAISFGLMLVVIAITYMKNILVAKV
jgi:ABC-type bacteriocin/lantibiotic exporter with double-glycine peptidase domain